MWRTPAARHVVFGSALAGFVGYGMTLWLPAFFVRSHGLSQTETGMTLALMSGIVGGLGTFSAGRLADYLGKRDPRWLVGCCGRKGRAGAVLGRLLFDHGSKVCVTDVSHSRILWRLLPCADVRHDSAAGACSNAGSCSRHCLFC